MTTKTDLIARLENLETEAFVLRAKIEAMQEPEPAKEKPERYLPGMYEVYWWLGSMGDHNSSPWEDTTLDHARRARGNCYPTKEAALAAHDRELVHYELIDLANFTPDWEDAEQRKLFFLWSSRIGRRFLDVASVNVNPRTVYFPEGTSMPPVAAKIGEERLKKYLQWSEQQ